jgi:hypothetical protein
MIDGGGGPQRLPVLSLGGEFLSGVLVRKVKGGALPFIHGIGVCTGQLEIPSVEGSEVG